MGFNSNNAFGFSGSGSGGGGGGSSPTWVIGVCGDAGGPVAGETTWTPSGAVLVGATQVDIASINGIDEYSFGGTPDFTVDDVLGLIDRAPNIWVAGDRIVLFYKPAS